MAKVVLITGANKGIGFEVARQLGRSGFTVLLGARDSSRGEAAATKLRGEGSDVRPVVADLDRATETATALAGQIEKEFGHLDVLINNAGTIDYIGDGPASRVSIDAMKRTFATNFFGTVEFTQPLLPLLRAAESARILNVSSGLGSFGINSDPASPFYAVKPLGYNASKAALNMFSVNLAWELRDTKIKVKAICPGFTATDLNNNTGTQTIEEGAIAIVRFAQVADDSPTGEFFHKDGNYPWEVVFSGCRLSAGTVLSPRGGTYQGFTCRRPVQLIQLLAGMGRFARPTVDAKLRPVGEFRMPETRLPLQFLRMCRIALGDGRLELRLAASGAFCKADASMGPGHSTFTRMRRSFGSTSKLRAKARSAALLPP